MPREAAGLSARKVETIREPGMYADGGGLYLQVTRNGAKSWIFRFQLAGKRREMGLGSLSTLTLAAARERAQEARRDVLSAIDPIDAKRTRDAQKALEAARLMTFEDAATEYVRTHRAGWRNVKHAGQWTSTLRTYVFPTIGKLPIADVDTSLVVRVLSPIWTEKPETAGRVRGRVESILDWARVQGHRTGENPARWRGHLDHILPSRRKVARPGHHASMAYADVPKFFLRLQAHDGLGARALELAILTAGRTGEVLGARWDEIDFERATWTVPADRMKAGREHRVPLSAPALTLLRKLEAVRMGDFLFPGQRPGKPLSNMSMAMVLRRMKLEATPHGFRASFRTWAAEMTTFPEPVVEMALAHTIEDRTVAAYQRGDLFDRRAKLMDAWAGYVAGAARVVPLRRAQ
jgi:integrase